MAKRADKDAVKHDAIRWRERGIDQIGKLIESAELSWLKILQQDIVRRRRNLPKNTRMPLILWMHCHLLTNVRRRQIRIPQSRISLRNDNINAKCF